MQQSTVPQTLAGRYRVDRMLGKGGMGIVYLAYDSLLENEPIALKVLHRELVSDESQMRRFLREVQVTRKITHPNVVRTFDIGLDDGTLYMTMELIEGSSLREHVAKTRLEPKEIVRILLEICDGLDAIHAADVIHRDLKPANVLIASDGTIHVTDFGVAHQQRSTLTSPNQIIGSAAYMAPELWRGDPATVQTDLYALGILAYEIATGAIPYDGDSPAEVMAKHLTGKFQPPQERRPELPSWLCTLIGLLMATTPARRPTSAAHAAQVLRSGLAQLQKASVAPPIASPSLAPAKVAGMEQPIPDESGERSAPPLPVHTTGRRPSNDERAPRVSQSASSPDSQRARSQRQQRVRKEISPIEDLPPDSYYSTPRRSGPPSSLTLLLRFLLPSFLIAALVYGLAVDLSPGASAWWQGSTQSAGLLGNIVRFIAPPFVLIVLWGCIALPFQAAAFTGETERGPLLLRFLLLPLALFVALLTIDVARLGTRVGFFSETFTAGMMRSISRQSIEKMVHATLLSPIGPDTRFGYIERIEPVSAAGAIGKMVTAKTAGALDLRLANEQRKLNLRTDSEDAERMRAVTIAGVPLIYLICAGCLAGSLLYTLGVSWFGTTSELTNRIMPTICWVLALALIIQLSARSFILPHLPASIPPYIEIPFLFFPIMVEGYALVCGALNWTILLFMLLVVSPRCNR